MKVIVTGATGFIGRNIAESFYDEGMHVEAIGRSEEIGAELLEKGIVFHPVDILHHVPLARALSPADCLIHCAGKSGDWGQSFSSH